MVNWLFKKGANSVRVFIFTFFFAVGLVASGQWLVAWAAGIIAKLDTNDGSTSFAIQDSDGNEVFSVTSKGVMRVNGLLPPTIEFPFGLPAGDIITPSIGPMNLYTVPAGKTAYFKSGTQLTINGLGSPTYISPSSDALLFAPSGTVLSANTLVGTFGYLADNVPSFTPVLAKFRSSLGENYTVPAGYQFVFMRWSQWGMSTLYVDGTASNPGIGTIFPSGTVFNADNGSNTQDQQITGYLIPN